MTRPAPGAPVERLEMIGPLDNQPDTDEVRDETPPPLTGADPIPLPGQEPPEHDPAPGYEPL
ncbi:hypothetical protein [Streptomyces olivaceoviridis]|uniref:Uncharacterized protein n=1 Tax=Streptomyces canarius TaxID=285453 RepID=A0ABQ3DJ03_9ACTN|nr:hypothetical protein GCM10010345_94090 [Streptomyces canarius]